MNRFSNLFRREQVDDELEEELQFHLDARTRDNLSAGMNTEAAQHDARRRFGNVTLAKERAHEMNIVLSIDAIGRDLRYSLRGLRKSPGFALVAILTLALGIGANTAVFSVVDAVLLRPLPYANADRLVMIAERLPKEPAPIFDTYREFEEWDRSSKSFESMAAITWAKRIQTILSWHGEKKEVFAVPVSVNFFSMLGIAATRGRTFAAKDLTSDCTVVLAYPFWRKQLEGSPDWIGKSLTLDDRACIVAGVMPKEFSFYPKRTELWTLITPGGPFAQTPWDTPVLALGLLKPGVSRAAAQAEVASIQSRIITESPSWAAMKLEPALEDLQAEFTWLTGRNLRRGLIILFAVVGFIMLIACVNVANLLTGRATVRQKELGMRAALGAGRSRLIQQLLTESAVLSLLGASLGVVLAILCVRFIATEEAMQLPPGNPISVNWEALVFTLFLAILTGLLFGVAPAWKLSRVDLNEVLKQSQPAASRGAGSHRTSRNLVVAEIALSLMVLVAAGLLVQSLIRLTTAPLGYESNGLLTADLRLPKSSYPKPEDSIAFFDRLGLKLDSLPGVEGFACGPSFAFARGTERVTIAGSSGAPQVVSALQSEPVSERYFQVAGVPLLQGREFSDADRSDSMEVAIVNEAFAKQYFPKSAAIGQRIKAGEPDSKKPWLTIVGITGDVSRPTLFESYSRDPAVYQPLRQAPSSSLTLFVRTTGNSGAAEPEIGRAITAVDSSVPLPTVQTVKESLSYFFSEPQFRAKLFSLFSMLALLLAAVGIYGVLSQLVAQRTQEIGVRVALGAQREDVLKLILGEGLRLALLGIAIGIAGSLALARFLSSMLYGVTPTDPLTVAAVSCLLLLVALFACYLPARRAVRLDPLTALRCE